MAVIWRSTQVILFNPMEQEEQRCLWMTAVVFSSWLALQVFMCTVLCFGCLLGLGRQRRDSFSSRGSSKAVRILSSRACTAELSASWWWRARNHLGSTLSRALQQAQLWASGQHGLLCSRWHCVEGGYSPVQHGLLAGARIWFSGQWP